MLWQLFRCLRKNSTMGVGLSSLLLLFSQSKVVGIFRTVFLKAIVYVCGIWMLEKYFGTIANGLSQLSAILVAFGLVIIMMIVLVIILKSVKA